jgi:hypothetical protein
VALAGGRGREGRFEILIKDWGAAGELVLRILQVLQSSSFLDLDVWLNEFLERKIKVASSIGSDRYSVGFIGGGAARSYLSSSS